MNFNTLLQQPSFAEVAKLVNVMQGYTGVWWISGGWAIDMHVGRVLRPHDDLDISIPRADQHKLREFLGRGLSWHYTMHAMQDVLQPWQVNQTLDLACQQVQVALPVLAKLEVSLNDFTEEGWVYRPDSKVTLPWSAFQLEMPAPWPAEIVLLYKASHLRPKDGADFAALLPLMTAAQREWLRSALVLAAPGHMWIERL